MPRDVAVQGGCAWSGLSPLPVSSSTGLAPAKGELIWLSRCAGWLWSRANCYVKSAGSSPSGWNSASPAARASFLGCWWSVTYSASTCSTSTTFAGPADYSCRFTSCS